MKKMEHTKEPWSTAYRRTDIEDNMAQEIFDSNGQKIATCAWFSVSTEKGHISTNREANARRIVACVNACVGISTENLEELKDGLDSHSVVVLVADLKKAENQRDELVALLKDGLSDEMGFAHIHQDWRNRIVDTIARIEGGK